MIIALTWPALFGSAVANVAGASLMKLPPCDPDSPACQPEAHPYPPEAWAGNRPQLEALRSRLRWAVNLAPRVESLRLRLADTHIAFKNRAEAAALLPSARQALQSLPLSDVPSARARIQSLASYERYLIAAYQQMEARRWEAAVQAFRLALSFGAADMQPADHQAYLSTLAHWHAQQAEEQETARSAYLAGKYFTRAGQWTSAEEWLQRAQRATDWNELSAEEQARTWIYLGRVHEQAGALTDARMAYETASRLAPKLREARLQLLALLRQLQDTRTAENVANDLASLGPKYYLGRFGAGFNDPEPTSLENGWTLIGYDLDEESLEAGSLFDIWLWWQSPEGESSPTADWLQVGDYWIQHQEVLNLAPDPGFEWGLDNRQLPWGFTSKYDESGVLTRIPGVAIVSASDATNINQILQLRDVGIKTSLLYVERQARFLAAGWLRHMADGDGHATLGWQCFKQGQPSAEQIRYRPGGVYSKIGELASGNSTQSWVHVAHVYRMTDDLSQSVPAVNQNPSQRVLLCQLYLEQVDGAAQFDRLLFVKLPAQTGLR